MIKPTALFLTKGDWTFLASIPTKISKPLALLSRDHECPLGKGVTLVYGLLETFRLL